MTALETLVEQLCQPHRHTEPVWERNGHGHWRMTSVVTTTQDGLLRQLHDALEPGGAASDGTRAGGGYGPREPLRLDALSRHAVISIAAARWCWDTRTAMQSTVEGNVLALVDASRRWVDETLRHQLAVDVRTWHTWASVLTGWQAGVWTPPDPCPMPGCGRRNALRIHTARQRAMCSRCGAAWASDDDGFNDLAAYVRMRNGSGKGEAA